MSATLFCAAIRAKAARIAGWWALANAIASARPTARGAGTVGAGGSARATVATNNASKAALLEWRRVMRARDRSTEYAARPMSQNLENFAFRVLILVGGFPTPNRRKSEFQDSADSNLREKPPAYHWRMSCS